jgi:hypothetical protein
MMPLKLRTAPDRNRSKQKHDKNTIYRPRAIRGVILVKTKHRNENTGENQDGNEFQGGHTTGWRGQ